MWSIDALVNGEWARIEPTVIENDQPPSLSNVLGNVGNATHLRNSTKLLKYLNLENGMALEGKNIISAHDAIELWALKAEEDSREFDWVGPCKLKKLEESLAYFSSDPKTAEGQLDTLAWHDHTTVVIPVASDGQHLMIKYTPGLRDENRVERLKFRYGTSDHHLETIFEARGYYGTDSAVVDHWREMRRGGRGYVASLRSASGFLVGRILRRLTVQAPALRNDPTFRRRLTAMCETFPGIADRCVDLASLGAVQYHDDAVVFIHGTVSCGIQSLKDLSNDAPAIPIYRYEHDTFLPVSENAAELADLIMGHVRAKRLFLVAHSRGGLAARIALHKLMRAGYGGETRLLTFGTPHEGTPLANCGRTFVNLLFKLGSYVVGGIPLMTPMVAAYSFVYDSSTLPTGISVMEEGSDALKTLNEASDPTHVYCWGSKFDMNKGSSGFSIDVEGALMGAMSGLDHDLVVPTHSALSFGSPRGVFSCSHIEYFANAQVKKAIWDLITPVVIKRIQPRSRYRS